MASNGNVAKITRWRKIEVCAGFIIDCLFMHHAPWMLGKKENLLTNTQPTTHRALAGKCLCGVVRYTVTDAFLYAANCHCSNCRRATGSAFKPFAGIARDKLGITKGADNLMIYGDANTNDTHCKSCGSLLYSVVRDGGFVHVTLGTLVDDPTIRASKHIFVGSKAPWYSITDNLPQYQEHAVVNQ